MKLPVSLAIVALLGVVSCMLETPEHGGKHPDHIKVDHVGADGQHDSAYDHKAILG